VNLADFEWFPTKTENNSNQLSPEKRLKRKARTGNRILRINQNCHPLFAFLSNIADRRSCKGPIVTEEERINGHDTSQVSVSL